MPEILHLEMDRLWGLLTATNVVIAVGIAGVVYFLASGEDEAEATPAAPAAPENPPPAAPVAAPQVAAPPAAPIVPTDALEDEVEEIAPPHPIRQALVAVVEPVESFVESLSPQQQAMLVLLCLVVIAVYVIVTLLQALGVPPVPLLAPVGWAAAGSLTTFAISSASGNARPPARRAHEHIDAGAEPGGVSAGRAAFMSAKPDPPLFAHGRLLELPVPPPHRTSDGSSRAFPAEDARFPSSLPAVHAVASGGSAAAGRAAYVPAAAAAAPDMPAAEPLPPPGPASDEPALSAATPAASELPGSPPTEESGAAGAAAAAAASRAPELVDPPVADAPPLHAYIRAIDVLQVCIVQWAASVHASL